MPDITLRIKMDGRDVEAKASIIDADLKQIRQSSKSVSDELANWSMVMTGINQTVQLGQQIFSQLHDSVMQAASVDVMRANFKGTAEDIELIGKAVNNTVHDGGLLRLSNQANDLGINFKQQPILFALAKRAADIYNTDVETGFQKVIIASDGQVKALAKLGIQKAVYTKIVNDEAKALGATIDKLDPEIQKTIRLDAIIKASGITLDDINNKTDSEKDKLQQLGVKVDEAKEAFGRLVVQGLKPAIDYLDKTGEAGTVALGGVTTIVSFILPLIPAIVSLKAATKLWGGETSLAAGAVESLNIDAKGLMGTLTKWAPTIGLGLMIADKLLEEANALIKVYKMLNPDELEITLPKPETTSTQHLIKTIGDINKKIEQLKTSMIDMVPGTKEWVAANLEVQKLEKSITFDKKTAEEKLKVKLDYYDELVIYDNKYLADYQAYLAKELQHYKDLQAKKKNGIKDFTEAEISAYNDLIKRKKELDSKQAMPGLIQLASNFPTKGLDAQGIVDLAGAQKKVADKIREQDRTDESAQIEEWRKVELEKYKGNKDAELAVEEVYKNRKVALAKKESQAKMQIVADSIQFIGQAFGQETAMAKGAALANTYMSTYEAAAKALTAGPFLGPLLAALITIAGMEQVNNILSVKVPAYAKGGVIVGENGPEVIAPAQDYVSGNKMLIAQSVIATENALRSIYSNGGGIGGGINNKEIINKLDGVQKAFEGKQFIITNNAIATSNRRGSKFYDDHKY